MENITQFCIHCEKAFEERGGRVNYLPTPSNASILSHGYCTFNCTLISAYLSGAKEKELERIWNLHKRETKS